MLQSMESSSWLHWLYSQPMYIANTGGATGGLPITRPPSFATPESVGPRSVTQLEVELCRGVILHSMSAVKCVAFQFGLDGVHSSNAF